jgi:hypothetical protein
MEKFLGLSSDSADSKLINSFEVLHMPQNIF